MKSFLFSYFVFVCECVCEPGKVCNIFLFVFPFVDCLTLPLPSLPLSLFVCHTCCRWRCHNTLIRVIYNTFVLASVRLAAAAATDADAGRSQVPGLAAARQLYCILSRGGKGSVPSLFGSATLSCSFKKIDSNNKLELSLRRERDFD